MIAADGQSEGQPAFVSDPEQVGGDRPLPADLGPVGGVGAGPFSAVGGLVQAAVDGDLGQVQSDDLVVTGDGLFDQFVEHAGLQPFGASVAQGGLPCGGEPGCDVPGAAGDQPHQDAGEAVPVGDSRSVVSDHVIP